MPAAIEIRAVTKTFGPKRAVDSLDLTVEEGGLYGFIGPNGAGKTTTIRMIMSIIFPDTGSVSVLGRASAVESKDRIGYLPEERGIYRKMKVGAFLRYMADLKGVDPGAADRKVKDWLARVGLAECIRKRCEELSKGMQQKVQFISAVLHEPDLIILDEPFSGLDPVNRRLLRELIDEQHRANRTVIFSTHAMFEAEQLCQHLFMISRGRKVLDAPLEEVWRRYDPRMIVCEPESPPSADDGAVFRSIPGVRDAVVNGREVDVRLHEGADPCAVIGALSTRIRVRRTELKKPKLEDIFIELVGGSAAALRAEAGETDAVEEPARA